MSTKLRSEYNELQNGVLETLLMKVVPHLSARLNADGFEVSEEKLNEYLNSYGEEEVVEPVVKKTTKKAPAKKADTKKEVSKKESKPKKEEPVKSKAVSTKKAPAKKTSKSIVEKISERKLELNIVEEGKYFVNPETKIAFTSTDNGYVAVGVLGKDKKLKKLTSENVKFLEGHNIEVSPDATEQKPPSKPVKPKKKVPEPEPEEEEEVAEPEEEVEEEEAQPDEEDGEEEPQEEDE